MRRARETYSGMGNLEKGQNCGSIVCDRNISNVVYQHFIKAERNGLAQPV